MKEHSFLIIALFIILCITICLLVISFYHIQAKRLISRLENMINAAINGSFTEQIFDESRLSSLECRFAKYLSSAETSYRNINAEKNRIKELISDISHQTKTPIANILLYSELLKEQDLSEEAKQYLSSLTAQTEKLNFLIASLIKLSRLETGILALSLQKNDIFPMLEKLAAQYAPLAKEKGLAFSINDPDPKHGNPAAVFDEKWTFEAIGNLIDNAVKYTEKGSVVLTVKSYEMYQCIQIADTGIGIPEQEQPRIFSRFYRSEAVRERSGVGIGLSLAREILSLEGGYIKICSKPGRGSVFSVFLLK